MSVGRGIGASAGTVGSRAGSMVGPLGSGSAGWARVSAELELIGCVERLYLATEDGAHHAEYFGSLVDRRRPGAGKGGCPGPCLFGIGLSRLVVP